MSIAQSTVPPFEIVVVNDGGAYVEESTYSDYQLPLRFIQYQVSKGANYARNRGVEESSSDIIFLIDDDDAFTSNSFESRLKIMKEDFNVGLCFTGTHIVSDNNLNKILRSVSPRTCEDYHYSLFRYGNVIGSTSRVAIKKVAFQKVGGFDEKLKCRQDYDLWIRMSEVTSIAHDSSCGIYYTVHASNEGSGQVSKNYKNYLEAGRYLFDKYCDVIEGYGLSSHFMSIVYRRVAISAAPSSWRDRLKYSILSILKRPSIKGFILLLPFRFLRAVRLLN